MMKNHKKQTKKPGFKRTILEWLGIAAVVAILYFTGLYTEVLGTMQRGILWTGLFNAEVHKVETANRPKLPESAYNMVLSTRKGNRVSLEEFKGGLLFINFWASWCPPCIAEMPTIRKLYKRVSGNKNIRFLMISMDENHQKAVKFMENKSFPMPFYFPSSRVPDIFQTSYIPSTYVISPEGKIIYKKQGIADYSSGNFRHWLIKQAKK
jgi:thiol-disulfide isomerase/thioredoxin